MKKIRISCQNLSIGFGEIIEYETEAHRLKVEGPSRRQSITFTLRAYITGPILLKPQTFTLIPTGIKIEDCGLLMPTIRSSDLCTFQGLMLGPSEERLYEDTYFPECWEKIEIGVFNDNDKTYQILNGDPIASLVFSIGPDFLLYCDDSDEPDFLLCCDDSFTC